MDIGVIPGAFVRWPFLALVLSAVFAFMYRRYRRPIVLAALFCWVAYFAYEQAMQLRILCSGECNIRVDLLLLYPLLIVVSVRAAIVYLKAKQDRPR